MRSELQKELQALNEDQQSELAANLKEINDLANEAYAAKVKASEADQKAKDLKNKLSALMETAGVDKISASDCTVSGAMKTSVTVPKEMASKLELFNYISEKYGNEVLDAMLTINARAFSSWHDKEVAAEAQQGNLDFKLDMLSPYEYYSVGFRKKGAK